MPKKRRGRPRVKKKSVRKPQAQIFSEKKLRKEQEKRGITALAKKLSKDELDELKHSFLQSERIDLKNNPFVRIAKKHKVTPGDLEQALSIRLGPEIRKPNIFWWKNRPEYE